MFVALKICHKFGVRRFSKSLVHVDLPNRINPIVATKTVDRCNVWRWLAGNLAIPRIAGIIRKRIEGGAKRLPTSARLLPDRIRRRLGSMMAATYGIN